MHRNLVTHRAHGASARNKCRSTTIQCCGCCGTSAETFTRAWHTAPSADAEDEPAAQDHGSDSRNVDGGGADPLAARARPVLQLLHSKSLLLPRRHHHVASLASLEPTSTSDYVTTT